MSSPFAALSARLASDDIGLGPAVLAASVLSCLGLGTFLLLPTLVEAAASDLHFSEWQLGILSAVLSGGTMLAGLVAPLWIRSASWQWAAALALGGLVAANAAALAIHGFAGFSALEGLVGFFGGSLYSLSLTVLSDAKRPDRAFTCAVGAQTIYQALALVAGPFLIASGGMNGVLAFFIGISASGLLLVRALPEHGHGGDVSHGPVGALLTVPVMLTLAGCFLFYVNIGAFWTYIDPIGRSAGLSAGAIANALAAATAASFLGVILTYALGIRAGYGWPIAVSALAIALSVGVLWVPPTLLVLFLSNSVYAICWNVSMTYQYSAVNHVDTSRRAVALAPSFHNAGSAVGPAIAAYAVGPGNFTGVLWLVCGSVTVSAAYFGLALQYRGRQAARPERPLR